MEISKTVVTILNIKNIEIGGLEYWVKREKLKVTPLTKGPLKI